jgi:4-amino-4-deoxy-L-arabinose transferase-like glycosyltransferase
LRSRFFSSWVLLVVLFGLALTLRLSFAHRGVFFPDSSTYLSISRAIVHGQLSTTFRGGVPTYLPPLYPLATTLFYPVIGDMEGAGVFVSLLAGALLVLPIFLLARSLYGSKAAWIASVLVAINPLMVKWSLHILTEALFILAYVSAAAVGWKALKEQRRGLFFFAGGLCALAYLTRLIGITLLPVLLFWTAVFAARHRRGIKPAAVSLGALGLGFLILAAPYWIYIHQETGQWSLAPYYDVIHTMATSGADSAEDTTLKTDGVSPGVFSKIQVNFRTYVTALTKTLSVSLLFIAMIVLVEGYRQRLAAFLTSGSIYVLTMIASYFSAILLWIPVPSSVEHVRYISPLIPFFLLLASGGIVAAVERVPRGQSLLLAAAVAALVVSFVIQLRYVPGLRNFPAPWQPVPTPRYQVFGAWIKERVPGPRVMMARNPHIPYYSDSTWFMTPTTLPEVLKLAQSKRVDYLIVDRTVDGRLRPELAFLLDPQRAPKNFELIAAQQLEQGPIMTVLYRMKRDSENGGKPIDASSP